MTGFSRSIVLFLVGSGAASVVLAVLGPFGTFTDLSFVQRLIYWGSIVFPNGVQVSVLAHVIVPRLPAPRWHPAVPLAIACVIASVPATAEVFWLENWLRPGNVDAVGILSVFLFVVVVTLALGIPMGLIVASSSTTAPGSEPTTATPESAAVVFVRRHAPHLTGPLTCLKTEDHYLRVHTPDGEALILMRLRDAVHELADAEGMQVHRSYWVARTAVEAIERDDGKTVLQLSKGLRVPVSRMHLPFVRNAG